MKWLDAQWSRQVLPARFQDPIRLPVLQIGTLLRRCEQRAEAGVYPSTGLYGLMSAVLTCDSVSAFGFGGPGIGLREHYCTAFPIMHTD